MISWITENVAIGDYKDGSNVRLILKENIDCILDLRRGFTIMEGLIEETENLCAKEGWSFYYYHIEVGSCKGVEAIKIELRTAAYMLEQLVEQYNKVLIHCTAGIDRAPFVVACYLAKLSEDEICDLKYWIVEAYKFIKRKRPEIKEHMEWI